MYVRIYKYTCLYIRMCLVFSFLKVNAAQNNAPRSSTDQRCPAQIDTPNRVAAKG